MNKKKTLFIWLNVCVDEFYECQQNKYVKKKKLLNIGHYHIIWTETIDWDRGDRESKNVKMKTKFLFGDFSIRLLAIS